MNYQDLIKLIKPFRLAKLMNIPATTVYSWKYNGIPSWRITAIKEALKAVPNG